MLNCRRGNLLLPLLAIESRGVVEKSVDANATPVARTMQVNVGSSNLEEGTTVVVKVIIIIPSTKKQSNT